MKHAALFCLSALAVAFASPVFAQDAGPTVTAAAPTRWKGLTVAEVTERLTAAGLTVQAPQTNADRVYLVVDDGPLRWVMTLFSCTDGACPDAQFTAAFSGANATSDIVSHWNGERRFVKAFYAAPTADTGNEARAVAQYDILMNEGGGPAQLDDQIQVWRSLALDLGRTVASPDPNAAAPTAPTTPPAQ